MIRIKNLSPYEEGMFAQYLYASQMENRYNSYKMGSIEFEQWWKGWRDCRTQLRLT